MHIFRRLIGFVLLAALMVTGLTLPAAAADSDYTFYGTAGKTEYFVITSDETDLITEAYIESGSVPGMELNVAGDVTLGLAGVPSADGEYNLCIAYTTRDHGNIRITVTVYINPSSTCSGLAWKISIFSLSALLSENAGYRNPKIGASGSYCSYTGLTVQIMNS